MKRWIMTLLMAVVVVVAAIETRADTILFSDDFNSGNTDRWTKFDGSFAVGDALQVISNNGDWSNNNDARAVAGSTSWTDYSVDFDYKIADVGVSPWPVACLFRVEDIASGVDNGHYYQFQLGPNILGFAEFWGTSSARTVFKEINVSLGVGTWHHLRLNISGSTGTACVDGSYSVTYDGFTDYVSGGIGLKCINGGSALFDNVQVQSVPEPSTFVLLGFGAVSLAAYSWRRKRGA